MENIVTRGAYEQMNFGTVPTTAKSERIEVQINPQLMFGDFAQAYASEFRRRNPIRAQEVGLTKEEIQKYIEGILLIHLENDSNNNSSHWREAKQLLIPTWIEFIISKIGTVTDIDSGLTFVPVYEGKYDLNEMLQTSRKMEIFINDGIALHRDAFPRDTTGDLDFMSYAILDDYVYSMRKESHPITSYVAAFLGMKLKQEAAFKMLYRVRYDDVEFIRQMLFSDGTIL